MHLLENRFKNGYRDGDMVLYMSLEDKVGESQNITTDIIQAWDLHWGNANDVFESFIFPQSGFCHTKK